MCARVLDTAVSACEDKKSLLFGELRNTAGSRYYDLNRLGDCRKAWEDTLRIRKELLTHDDPQSKHASVTWYISNILSSGCYLQQLWKFGTRDWESKMGH
jgi:hypothetical protein